MVSLSRLYWPISKGITGIFKIFPFGYILFFFTYFVIFVCWRAEIGRHLLLQFYKKNRTCVLFKDITVKDQRFYPLSYGTYHRQIQK